MSRAKPQTGSLQREQCLQKIKELETNVEKWQEMLAKAKADLQCAEAKTNVQHAQALSRDIKIKEDSYGTLIWGCLSKKRWYPGVIIHGEWAAQPAAEPGKVWIIWFADYRVTKECVLRQGIDEDKVASVLEDPEKIIDILTATTDGDPLAPKNGRVLPQKMEAALTRMSKISTFPGPGPSHRL